MTIKKFTITVDVLVDVDKINDPAASRLAFALADCAHGHTGVIAVSGQLQTEGQRSMTGLTDPPSDPALFLPWFNDVAKLFGWGTR